MDVNVHSPSVEGVEDLLADLDMSGIGESVEEVIEELSATDLSAVEVAEAMDEAYADQDVVDADITTPEAPAVEASTEKKARKPRSPSVPKDLGSLDPSVFVLSGDDTGEDLVANKAHVIGLMPKQKKIAEKFENLFRSIAGEKLPSVYVMECFNVLRERGEVTSSDLVAALKTTTSRKGAPYNDGTARSQAGQIMALFDVVGIAHRSGQKLTANPASVVAKKLTAIASASAPE